MLRYRHLRWIIVALLFASTVLNYADRQTLSVLAPTLRQELHLSDQDYAHAVSAFLLTYTIMYSFAGRLIDRIGVRVGLGLCIAWWSLATMLTAFARGPISLAMFRMLLGVGEPGVFPAGLKATSEWFPRRERGLPAGIFSSGSAAGAVIAPPLIAWLTIQFGWRYAFFIPGSLALLWLPLWIWIYRSPFEHPSVDEAEREALRVDAAETREVPRRSWLELLRQRSVWGLVLPRMASDPVWYFYLFWLRSAPATLRGPGGGIHFQSPRDVRQAARRKVIRNSNSSRMGGSTSPALRKTLSDTCSRRTRAISAGSPATGSIAPL